MLRLGSIFFGNHFTRRAHKSHLVNKKFVKHPDKESLLWLTDGSHIIVSRRKKEEVLKELSNK